MVDLTDDWMNPPTRSYSAKPPEDKWVYAIMRAKREVCFGDPGS